MLPRKTVNIVTGDDMKERIRYGVSRIASAVGGTLGPNGKPVLIEYEAILPVTTKDGFYVANSCYKLEDPVEYIGASMVLQAAHRQAMFVGDGTSSTIILAEALLRACDDGIPPGKLREMIVKVSKAIKKKGIPADRKLLHDVARVSGNGDEVGDVVDSVLGEDPGRHVLIEEGGLGDTMVTRNDGYVLPRGSMLAGEHQTVTADNCAVLVVSGKITGVQDAVASMQLAAQNGFTSLLVVAQNIEGGALDAYYRNVRDGRINVILVHHGWRASENVECCRDLATYVGGKAVICPDGRAADLRTIDQSFLGKADKVTSKNGLTIIEADGFAERVKDRIAEIVEGEKLADTENKRQSLERRRGTMTGGFTVIRVGGGTDADTREKKDRFEDAVYAVKSAAVTGVLPGAGNALAWVADHLDEIGVEKQYIEFLSKALWSVAYRLYDEPYPVDANGKARFDAAPGHTHSLVEDGIVDPVGVVLGALVHASSAAIVLASAGSSVVFSETYRNMREVAE